MIQEMLAYFKSYQIDVDQLLVSGNSNGSLEITCPKDLPGKKVQMNYKIDNDANETAFFFWCRNDKQHREWIHNFSNGFKNIVRASKAVMIERPGPEKEWYGWCEINTPVSYMVKNELLGFSMRILIPKTL